MNALTPTYAHLAGSAGPATLADPAEPLRRFVADHFDALWHAACLLGGYEAAREVGHLATAFGNEPILSRSTDRRLQNLLDLLRLENVGDPERVEWGCFAVIDPADPCVAEICLLTEGFAKVVADWRASRRSSPPRDSVPVPRHRAA